MNSKKTKCKIIKYDAEQTQKRAAWIKIERVLQCLIKGNNKLQPLSVWVADK